MTNKCLWIFVLLEIIQASANSTETLNILLIGSRHDLSKQQISVEKNQIRTDCKQSKISCAVHDVENDDLQNENVGMWTIFPMLNKLKHQKSYWYLVGDDQSHVNILNFVKFVESKNPEEMWFFGFGLHDKEPTIIHHFGFDVPENFLYPLISAGFLLSKGLIENLPTNLKLPNFAIDSKHEFAKLIYNNSGKLMIHEPIHFCAQQQENCVVSWKTIENLKIEEVLNDDVYVMVKTYHGHHQTRIPIIQKTWAKHFKNLFYCSDSEDVNIPTIDMNVGNTERGHCSKTWAIFKKFEKMKKADAWLFIADDDTLVSYQNLMEMLASFNRSQKIIIGERYGYGFSISGSSGFDYPTGGAGMLFSFTAVESILKECPSCGSPDDPDDMMIGACALLANISIFHEPRMHQARPNDYNQIYLRNPITFHKFNDIDPIIAYEKYLNSPLKQMTFLKSVEVPLTVLITVFLMIESSWEIVSMIIETETFVENIPFCPIIIATFSLLSLIGIITGKKHFLIFTGIVMIVSFIFSIFNMFKVLSLIIKTTPNQCQQAYFLMTHQLISEQACLMMNGIFGFLAVVMILFTGLATLAVYERLKTIELPISSDINIEMKTYPVRLLSHIPVRSPNREAFAEKNHGQTLTFNDILV